MPRKGHSSEQVLNKLRQVEVAVAGGARVLGRQYERSVSPTTLIIGGDGITVESTSIRQKGSRS
jgi:hypothetical protein